MTDIPTMIRKSGLITPGEHVLVGCSGGADSLALTEGLRQLREELKLKLTVVHVHHHIRKETADADAAFVAEYCKEKEIPFVLKHVDAPNEAKAKGLSLEEAARNLRYRAFEEAARESGCSTIVLAHHRDDNAETFLFHLIRGSGLRGLSGIAKSRETNGFRYVRPLLKAGKNEICEWLSAQGLTWREDETNGSSDATRNRIRAEVLPALSIVRSDAAEKISATAEYLGEVDAYLRNEAREYFESKCLLINHERDDSRSCECMPDDGICEVLVLPEELKTHPRIFCEYVFAEVLRMVGEPMKDKGRVHLEQLLNLLNAPVGKKVVLSGGTVFQKMYDGIRVIPKIEPAEADIQAEVGTQAEQKTLSETSYSRLRHYGRYLTGLQVSDSGSSEPRIYASGRNGLRLIGRTFPYESGMVFPQKECTKWFDYDRIISTPILRTRQAGDRISTAPGMHKSLKDWFIDEKIPKEIRDKVPVVADGSQILWVIGYRMSEDYKITGETRTILELSIEPEKD